MISADGPTLMGFHERFVVIVKRWTIVYDNAMSCPPICCERRKKQTWAINMQIRLGDSVQRSVTAISDKETSSFPQLYQWPSPALSCTNDHRLPSAVPMTIACPQLYQWPSPDLRLHHVPCFWPVLQLSSSPWRPHAYNGTCSERSKVWTICI